MVASSLRIELRLDRKGFRRELHGSFLDLDSGICREVVERLHKPSRPTNTGSNSAPVISETEEELLRVLRQETRAGLHVLSLSMRSLDCYGRADRIAITLCAAQTKADRVTYLVHH